MVTTTGLTKPVPATSLPAVSYAVRVTVASCPVGLTIAIPTNVSLSNASFGKFNVLAPRANSAETKSIPRSARMRDGAFTNPLDPVTTTLPSMERRVTILPPGPGTTGTRAALEQ